MNHKNNAYVDPLNEQKTTLPKEPITTLLTEEEQIRLLALIIIDELLNTLHE